MMLVGSLLPGSLLPLPRHRRSLVYRRTPPLQSDSALRFALGAAAEWQIVVGRLARDLEFDENWPYKGEYLWCAMQSISATGEASCSESLVRC